MFVLLAAVPFDVWSKNTQNVPFIDSLALLKFGARLVAAAWREICAHVHFIDKFARGTIFAFRKASNKIIAFLKVRQFVSMFLFNRRHCSNRM